MNIKFKLLAVLALALAGMAIGVAQVSAHGSHHARFADADADGASNRCEVKAGTDPAVADSDGNGTADGAEDTDGDGATNAAESQLHSNCAVKNSAFKTIRKAEVVSFAADTGVLTIKLSRGGTIAAPLSSRLVCEMPDPSSSDDNSASTSRHGADDGAGDDRGGDSGSGSGRGGNDDGPTHDVGDDRGGRGADDNNDDTAACTSADLKAGTEIKRAKVRHGKFTKIVLSDDN
jgi:hypothetical protein